MTTSDKKKAVILVVLLIVAGFSWYFVFRPIMMGPSAPDVAVKPPAKTKPIKVTGTQGKIDMAPLAGPVPTDVGRRNLFQFPPKPVPKPTVVPVITPPYQPPQPQVVVQQQPPQPPPFKAFKYEGFSVPKSSGKMMGVVTEGGTSYQVKEGDYLMGQYQITRLTDKQVEIEDLQSKRRQTFAVVQ